MAQAITNLSLNDKIKYGSYKGAPIIWRIADFNHPGYPSNSVTLISDVILCEKAFDAKEPSNNNSDRQQYGNNRYAHSNLRQWLNKRGSPWYEAQHSADAPPNSSGVLANPYDTEPGFLTEFTDDELSVSLETTLTVAKNTVTDGGGSETVVDKIFLASCTEVGLANENGIAEGVQFPIFTDDASRIAQHNGSNDYWWLRTPFASNSRFLRYVLSGGSRSYDLAYYGNNGVRPLCNLKSDILVSDTTDSDGCYTVVWVKKYTITLDKPITATTADKLLQCKFTPKINGNAMELKEADEEKFVYTASDIEGNNVDLEIEGKDAKLDKVAYIIS
ncbi:DUF6273 domain-containing protein [Clostridium sp.]|uniref:DUF6273 domain-containing protein n=1 Tax=Clostridium sp. TaxID=1506 RepID=UPI003A297A58